MEYIELYEQKFQWIWQDSCTSVPLSSLKPKMEVRKNRLNAISCEMKEVKHSKKVNQLCAEMHWNWRQRLLDTATVRHRMTWNKWREIPTHHSPQPQWHCFAYHVTLSYSHTHTHSTFRFIFVNRVNPWNWPCSCACISRCLVHRCCMR